MEPGHPVRAPHVLPVRPADLVAGVQRLLKGHTGAWRTALMACVTLASPFAVMFSLVGGLLGPPGVLIGALIPYLLLVWIASAFP